MSVGCETAVVMATLNNDGNEGRGDRVKLMFEAEMESLPRPLGCVPYMCRIYAWI